MAVSKEGGAEIFCLPNETEQSILRFRKEDEKINLPHVPSKEVYFEVENFIYGPFFTSFSLPDNPCCVEVTIKPPYDKKVFKVSLNEFEQNYRPFVLKSTNRLAVYDDSQVASFEYKILHPQYLKKLEHERDSKWKLLDFELLSSKVRRLIGSSGCLSRNESRTLSDLLKKLESQVTLSTNPIALKELTETDTNEKNNTPLIPENILMTFAKGTLAYFQTICAE